MNFNSVVFLFCFMPLALGLYYLVPGRVKNAVLLVESLLFFCWGGITWLPLAVGMVAINYAAGLLLASLPAGGKRKIVLIAAIVLTAAALVYCKYTNFLLDTRDKYGALLDGNNGYSVIEGNGTGSILVVKDSYANSFIPYLTANYAKIGVVDFRGLAYGLDSTIEKEGYDQILILYNFQTFISDNKVIYLDRPTTLK